MRCQVRPDCIISSEQARPWQTGGGGTPLLYVVNSKWRCSSIGMQFIRSRFFTV